MKANTPEARSGVLLGGGGSNYNKKKIVFLTGTRADYGKIKQIMQLVEASDKFELFVFITGMHMLKQYGNTAAEVLKDGYMNTYCYINQMAAFNCGMDSTLGSTISGFGNYIREVEPDLIVVHGDRLEALAGAEVGALNNILVAHIEGGEVSGTIDESMRHAITKLSHVHFVSNEDAKKRIVQMGECADNVFVIGSPDIDIMLSDTLPSLEEAKRRYEIGFNDYAIAMFHPVTTSYKNMSSYAKYFVDALIESGGNYIVIHPNNDSGRDFIMDEYERLSGNACFRLFPSLRFEYFLTLLKNSRFIIGNSSAGVREAGVYAVPAIDIGDRQENRYDASNKALGILHTDYTKENILDSILHIQDIKHQCRYMFGGGKSAEQFMNSIENERFWNISIQKHFEDIE